MLHIEQAVALYCGGPGSGRHPEYGNFRHFTTMNRSQTFRSPKGTGVVVFDRRGRKDENWRTGEVRENGKSIHVGTFDTAKQFAKDRYGINVSLNKD